MGNTNKTQAPSPVQRPNLPQNPYQQNQFQAQNPHQNPYQQPPYQNPYQQNYPPTPQALSTSQNQNVVSHPTPLTPQSNVTDPQNQVRETQPDQVPDQYQFEPPFPFGKIVEPPCICKDCHSKAKSREKVLEIADSQAKCSGGCQTSDNLNRFGVCGYPYGFPAYGPYQGIQPYGLQPGVDQGQAGQPPGVNPGQTGQPPGVDPANPQSQQVPTGPPQEQLQYGAQMQFGQIPFGAHGPLIPVGPVPGMGMPGQQPAVPGAQDPTKPPGNEPSKVDPKKDTPGQVPENQAPPIMPSGPPAFLFIPQMPPRRGFCDDCSFQPIDFSSGLTQMPFPGQYPIYLFPYPPMQWGPQGPQGFHGMPGYPEQPMVYPPQPSPGEKRPSSEKLSPTQDSKRAKKDESIPEEKPKSDEKEEPPKKQKKGLFSCFRRKPKEETPAEEDKSKSKTEKVPPRGVKDSASQSRVSARSSKEAPKGSRSASAPASSKDAKDKSAKDPKSKTPPETPKGVKGSPSKDQKSNTPSVKSVKDQTPVKQTQSKDQKGSATPTKGGKDQPAKVPPKAQAKDQKTPVKQTPSKDQKCPPPSAKNVKEVASAKPSKDQKPAPPSPKQAQGKDKPPVKQTASKEQKASPPSGKAKDQPPITKKDQKQVSAPASPKASKDQKPVTPPGSPKNVKDQKPITPPGSPKNVKETAKPPVSKTPSPIKPPDPKAGTQKAKTPIQVPTSAKSSQEKATKSCDDGKSKAQSPKGTPTPPGSPKTVPKDPKVQPNVRYSFSQDKHESFMPSSYPYSVEKQTQSLKNDLTNVEKFSQGTQTLIITEKGNKSTQNPNHLSLLMKFNTKSESELQNTNNKIPKTPRSKSLQFNIPNTKEDREQTSEKSTTNILKELINDPDGIPPFHRRRKNKNVKSQETQSHIQQRRADKGQGVHTRARSLSPRTKSPDKTTSPYRSIQDRPKSSQCLKSNDKGSPVPNFIDIPDDKSKTELSNESATDSVEEDNKQSISKGKQYTTSYATVAYPISSQAWLKNRQTSTNDDHVITRNIAIQVDLPTPIDFQSPDPSLSPIMSCFPASIPKSHSSLTPKLLAKIHDLKASEDGLENKSISPMSPKPESHYKDHDLTESLISQLNSYSTNSQAESTKSAETQISKSKSLAEDLSKSIEAEKSRAKILVLPDYLKAKEKGYTPSQHSSEKQIKNIDIRGSEYMSQDEIYPRQSKIRRSVTAVNSVRTGSSPQDVVQAQPYPPQGQGNPPGYGQGYPVQEYQGNYQGYNQGYQQGYPPGGYPPGGYQQGGYPPPGGGYPPPGGGYPPPGGGYPPPGYPQQQGYPGQAPGMMGQQERPGTPGMGQLAGLASCGACLTCLLCSCCNMMANMMGGGMAHEDGNPGGGMGGPHDAQDSGGGVMPPPTGGGGSPMMDDDD